jgi:hypothetical protein
MTTPNEQSLRERIEAGIARRLLANKSDAGQALVLAVICVLLVAVLVPILGLTIATETVQVSRAQTSEEALAAAEAGIQDFRNYIDNVPQYYAYDCGNPDGNPALGSGAAPYACNTWAPVSGTSNEWFHYVPDTSQLQNANGGSPGQLLMEVTGRAGSPNNYAYRSLLVGYKLSGILTDSYYSEYELVDPNEPSVYPMVSVTSGGSMTTQFMNNVSVEYAYTSKSGVVQYFGPESLLDALCLYHTYDENTYVDSLGVTNPWVGSGASPASASNPYYGPYYSKSALTITVPATLPNGTVPPNAGATLAIGSGGICGSVGIYDSTVTFNGIAYSNDQLDFCGNPTFNGSPPLVSGAPTSLVYGDNWPGSQAVIVAGKTQYVPRGYTWDFYDGCSGGPNWGATAVPKAPELGGQQHLPSTTSFLKQYADGTKANGCLYTGPTMIQFVKGGTMNVWSPLSQSTEPNWSIGSQANCGTFSPSLPWQVGLPVPSDAVIYVEGEQSTGPNSGYAAAAPSINYASSPCSGTATPPSPANEVGITACYLSAGVYISAGQPLQPAVTASGGNAAIPAATCINPYFANYLSGGAVKTTPSTSSNCEEGDAIVEGEFHGQVTIAADNNIIISRDLTYQCADGSGGATDVNPNSVAACNSAGTNDVLGLLPNNELIIAHPLNQPYNTSCSSGSCNTSNAPICPDDGTGATQSIVNIAPWRCDISTNFSDGTRGISADAAVVSLHGSTYVPDFNVGACLGHLDQQGTNINYFPGFNGTSGCGSGYSQQISYDSRLAYENPPFLLAATDTVWNVTSFVVCGTVDTANLTPVNAGTSSAYQQMSCPALP